MKKINILVTLFTLFSLALSAQEEKKEKKVIIAEFDYTRTKRLGPEINTKYDEIAPFVSYDGNFLYFGRSFHPKNVGGENDGQDIWYSVRNEDGSWSKAVNIGKPLNNKEPNAVCGISSDDSTIYLTNQYLSKNKMAPGISYSKISPAGEWSKPTNFEFHDNHLERGFFCFDIAEDGKLIIMSMHADEDNSKEDLFFSKLQNGKWTKPVPLGDVINTSGFETSPFLASDDSTLFFSSDGHPGQGGGDIFVSKRLDDTWTNWTKPVNLGKEVNSKGFDGYFTLDDRGEFFYISGSNPRALGDIYTGEALNPFFEAFSEIEDIHTGTPLEGATVRVMDSETHEELEKKISDSKGGFSMVLENKIRSYTFFVEKEGYVPVDKTVKIEREGYFGKIELEIEMVPIKTGEVVELNNVEFEYGSYTKFTKSSYTELDLLVSMMDQNAKMTIEISGHTDSIGSDTFNQNLSEQRAQAVQSYFLDKGVKKERVTAVGYGETKPIAPNKTEEGRARNRRVEFTITHGNEDE